MRDVTHSKQSPPWQRWSEMPYEMLARTFFLKKKLDWHIRSEGFPLEDERTDISTNEDANDDVPVVVHGESIKVSLLIRHIPMRAAAQRTA
jgi:hypothetical protein